MTFYSSQIFDGRCLRQSSITIYYDTCDATDLADEHIMIDD